jgi:hypothetical protein
MNQKVVFYKVSWVPDFPYPMKEYYCFAHAGDEVQNGHSIETEIIQDGHYVKLKGTYTCKECKENG